jgi:hypothetical protein
LARLSSLRLSLQKIVFSIAISAAVAILTALVALAVSYLLFPITGVEVKGARMFPESEVREDIPSYASLFSLNTGILERRIESNPWVKGAKVLKDWESGIVTVEVEERKAVLNGDLGSRQVVVAEDGTELPGSGEANLDRVELDEAQLEDVLRIVEVLEENEVVLDSIDGVGAGGVEATVEGRRVLFASSVESPQIRVLAGFMEEHPQAPYFDLRSPKRIVIGADEPSTGSGTESGSSDG